MARRRSQHALAAHLVHPGDRLRCAARLAYLMDRAWAEYQELVGLDLGGVDPHSMYFRVPRGAQRREDLYRLSVGFTVDGGFPIILESWATCGEFMRDKAAHIHGRWVEHSLMVDSTPCERHPDGSLVLSDYCEGKPVQGRE